MGPVRDVMASGHPWIPPSAPVRDVLPSDCPNYHVTLLPPMVALEGTQILGSSLREDPLGSKSLLASGGPIFKFFFDEDSPLFV
jgi:hypothetical protein